MLERSANGKLPETPTGFAGPSDGEYASVEALTSASASIWRNRAFLMLFISYSLSLLGNTFHSIALNLWVLQTTGSAKLMSLVLISHLTISMLFGSLAGTIADRTDRRRLMWGSDLARFAAVGAIALFMTAQHPPFVPILCLSAFVAFAGTFRAPAFQASLVEIVGKDRVAQAVGAITLSDNFTRIGGYALGGIAVAAFGGAVAIAIDAGAFFISALLLLKAGRFPYTAERSLKDGKIPSFKEDFIEGFRFVWRDAFTRAASIMLPLAMFFFLSVFMLVQVMAVTVWQASPVVFGLIEASIPLGYVIGSLLIIRFDSKFRHRGRWVLGGFAAMGPVFAAIALMDSAAPALPLVLLLGLLFAFSTALVYIGLRTQVAPEMQGRVFGLVGSLTSVAPPAGLAIFAALSDEFGPASVIGFSGIALCIIGAIAYFKLHAMREYR